MNKNTSKKKILKTKKNKSSAIHPHFSSPKEERTTETSHCLVQTHNKYAKNNHKKERVL